MNRPTEQPDEYQRRFRELLDRMLQAGFIESHANLENGPVAIALAPAGQTAAAALRDLETRLAPLSHDDRLCLWFILTQGQPPAAAGPAINNKD